MKKIKFARRILIGSIVLALSCVVSIGIVYGYGEENTDPDWDVVFDSADSNDGIIYDGELWKAGLSLATRSNGYPGIVFANNSGGSSNVDLAYTECLSGDCASGDGAGVSQWSTPIIIDDYGTSRTGVDPALDYDPNGDPTIAFMKQSGNMTWLAKYVGSGGTGCSIGDSWSCFSIGDGTYGPIPDLVIDSSGNHYVAYVDSSYDLDFAQCTTFATTGCDEAADWSQTPTELRTSSFSGVSLDVDSSGNLHISAMDTGNDELLHGTCSSACTTVGNWTFDNVVDIGAGTGSWIDASTGTIAIAYTDTAAQNLKYAEYTGTGTENTCLISTGPDTYNLNWACTDVTSSALGVNSDTKSSLSLDISSTGERGISFGLNLVRDSLAYVKCTSSCTTNTNWKASDDSTDYDVFTDNGSSPGKDYGLRTSFEFGSGPRIAFSSYYGSGEGYPADILYAEQGDDDPPEEQIIPELPASNVWKILIAVLALGLVVGIAAFWNKKGKK